MNVKITFFLILADQNEKMKPNTTSKLIFRNLKNRDAFCS